MNQELRAFLFHGANMSDEQTQTKGDLVEKIVFSAVPILLTCVGYLLMTLNEMENKITILESKVAVVVSAENKPIPSEGTTVAMEQIRAEAAENRAQLKFEAAIARGDLEKRIVALEVKLDRR
jgi:homoserine dehydrogenase